MIPLIFFALLSAQPLYEVEEVVVTATRYPRALKDIALATVVIEKEEIQRLHPSYLGEILKTYAGIDIKDYGTPGSVSSIFIRGVPSNGTLILLNNHPLNSISTGMADLSSINVNAIERIEIIKGPVSSFYGADGLGGVVNIITTRDYEKPEIEWRINSSTTDFDELLQSKNIFTNVGLPIGKTTIALKGAYNASDGFRSNSDLMQIHFQGNVAYDFGRSHLKSVFIYDDKKYGIPGPKPLVDSIHPMPQFGDSTATSLFDREQDRIILGNVAIGWYVSDNVTWHTNFFGNRKLLDYHTVYPGWFVDTITENYEYLTHTIGLNSMAALTLDDTEVILGIDTYYDTLQTTKNSAQTGDTIWSASSYIIAGWLELKRRFGNITAIPRIRFDRNSEYGNFLSPGFGIVSDVMQNFSVKVSLGKAFRAPTLNDLHWPKVGNPELKPEHGWAYELRLESSPLHNLFAAFSFFMRTIKDRIFWLPTNAGLWQPQNVNYISMRGLDIEIRSQVNELLGLSLEGAYLDAKQKNNEVVYDFYDWFVDTSLTIIEEIERDAAFIPHYSASVKIYVDVPYDFTFTVQGSFVADQVNYYPNYSNYPNVLMDKKVLDSYFIVSVDVAKKLSEYLTLSVGAKNLLDTQYATQFGYMLEDLDYPMPGRTVVAQLIWGNK